jgi:fused signal recognition particle receptor
MSESGKTQGLFGKWFRRPATEEEPDRQAKDAPQPQDADSPAPEPDAPGDVSAPPEPDSSEPLAPVAPSAEPSAAEPRENVDRPVSGTSWFQRLRAGLSRSSSALTENLAGLLRKRRLDDDTLQDLEDVLIQADLGVETAMRITETLAASRYDKEITPEEVRAVLTAEVEQVLAPVARPLEIDPARKPHVILVVGVNGSGKTTTIGKLAAKFRADGLKTLLGAGDTFRAAAIDQLRIWGERTGAEVVARDQGSDASGLAYDALSRARETGADVLILDTAGRLHNKAHLMAELEKIVRVLKKQDDTAPHDVLLVLDATTGQNALQQVEIFRQVCGVSGLVMTKLDGTARGGILVAIAAKHGLPVHFVGVGEGVDDLQPFKAKDFARAIGGDS